MSALRKIKRVGKKASKFQYTATYQSVVVECQKIETWKPNQICVSWSRRGRRFFTQRRPWQASLDNPTRGVVIWPEKETMEITVTLYKGPKDSSYETKEWEFNVIDVDSSGKRKILAIASINMVRYASTMPFDHDVQLQMKPVSRKIKKVILDTTLCSILLKEGKATDDDMMSIASMMSVSNLSVIGNLEDDDDDNYGWHGGRSITPPPMPESVLSLEELLKWTQEVTADCRGVKITNMTTSWRTGMGFLAMFHYYRPDLIDIEAVSPNAIKENNRLAFELAHLLGISCPLTPGAMISATIPDKLLVSSFLFNMHQYFTRAVPSAIAKDSTQNGSSNQSPTSADKPSSPFDISKIHKVFDDPNIYNNLSPLTSPSSSSAAAAQDNRYSRHGSRKNSAQEDAEPEGRTLRVSGTDYGIKTHSSSSSLVHSSQKESTEGGQEGGGEGDRGTGRGGGVEGELVGALDRLVASTVAPGSQQPENTTPHIRVSSEGIGEELLQGEGRRGGEGGRGREGEATQRSFEEDRLLEFEGETESEPCTSSSVSLDEFRGENAAPLAPQTSTQVKETADTNAKVQSSGQLSASERREGEIESQSRPVDSGAMGRGQEEEEGEGGAERRKSEGEVVRETLSAKVDEQPRRRSEGVPYETGATRPQRRLPAIPTDSQETNVKHEERRQMAKDLLKKHRISPATADFFSSASAGKRKSLDSKQEKYREQVRQMLTEFQISAGTEQQTQEENSGLMADLSTTSLPDIRESDESRESSVPRNEEGEEEGAEGRGKGGGGERAKEEDVMMTEIVSYDSEPRTHRASADGGVRRRVGVVERPQVVVVGGDEDPASVAAATTSRPPARPRSATTHTETSRERLGSDKSRSRRGHANTGPGVDTPTSPTQPRPHRKRPPVKELQIKPVQSKPSAAAQKLVESKREKGIKTDGASEGGRKEEEEKDGDAVGVQNGGGNEEKHSGGGKLESPSPWYEHSEGLQQDILLTTNEYVRCELGRLQGQLQNMERRAVEIESDVRHAMATGNKEDEEAMMQEWFSLLNGKNELIKRQIELNLIEKEEDLEKKQFFINRKLRPLMQIPDDQKTPQQKSRTDILVQDLLGIVDERDKLERRKMSICSKSTPHERDGFAGGVSQSQTTLERHGSKDCVIS